ncbi:MAG: nuclear transport factor 2 family protein [Thermonemataceae bacterium]
MYKYFLWGLLSWVSLHTQGQSYTKAETQVRAAIQNYIDGRNTPEVALLQKAFHPKADLRYIKQDTLRIWQGSDYITGAANGSKQDCRARIVYVDVQGSAAQAKVEIEYPTKIFYDYINLLKEGDEWKIAVKTFSAASTKKKKILFVVTSHEQMGNTGKKTGLHLGEVSHAYKPLAEAGYVIDFVSPEGGSTFMYGTSMNDSINVWFMKDASAYYKLTHAYTPQEVQAADYQAIYFVGGHGTMWDLPYNTDLQALTSTIYEQGGVVAAVCHGPSGLLNVKLNDGSYLVKGKKLTAFTNEEEKAAKQDKNVPFLLESALEAREAVFVGADNWQENVVVDGRLVTGQNPASAHKMALEIIKLDQLNSK